MRRASVVVLSLAVAACSKSNDAPTPKATLGTVTATGSSVASASPATSTAATAAVPTTTTWTGHYSAVPGPFYVIDGGEWAGVRFRGEDSGLGLGDGTLSFTADPAGHVTGTLEGPLGPGHFTGELGGKAFSAWLVPADLAQGFTGTAVGTADGDKISGRMKLSLPTGNVIREASFSLDRKAKGN
jgi:hypothetical protein